ncbi:glycosyltransferase family 2 protein, partial [Helicobacter typhlonius]|uniref:glycosyltransferase family 2 protein n=1 Tax=Helicobacter typhlonius TaxID=76936 RepID=UPI002FDF1021
MQDVKTQEKPLVSVIIPIYNVEAYVSQCLDSIINQSYTNLEIICVNDGSTDKSGQIVQEYAKRDCRIIYLEQENQGGGAARNTGLDRAKGEWILIFDADDYMRPFAIETLVQRALQTQAQIVIAQSEELSQDGNIVPMDWALRLDLLPQKERFDYKDLGDYVFGFCVGWAWDKLYNRAFIESHNLRFEPVKSPSDDLLFTFSSLVRADSISVCEKMLFTHRKHATSLESSRDKNPTLFLSSVQVWKNSLMDMGIFSQVQRSFMNWTLSFCLWHLHTLYSNEAHYQLFVALKRALRDLGISHYPKAAFYNQTHYKQMRYILCIPLWLHRLNTWRICDIRGIFRLRLSKKGSVIRIFGKTLYSNGSDYL